MRNAASWWNDEQALQRFICSLVASELASLRPGGLALPGFPWEAGLHLVDDLGADSLELLGIATALAESLHMHESGFEDYLLARPTIGEWVQIAQASLQHFSGKLTFRTSGSTGQPKPCCHPLPLLMQEVVELSALFSGRRRILCAVPGHHIYGFLFTILLPRALGIDASGIIDLRGSSPARLANELKEGDLVVGHPEFWRAAARLLPSVPAGVIGVTSTAPCPAEVSQAIEEAGMHKLIQVYGSSETAGIGWRDSSTSPYRLFSHWKKSAEAHHGLLRMQPDGQETSYTCQDRLQWTGPREFLPAGRMDNAVQVGGINVFPARVRDVLLQHPEVADAAVRLMRPEEGARLKAFIVARMPGIDHAELQQRLHSWVTEHLTTAERPKAFTFGEQLPKSSMEKDADWLITPSLRSTADVQ
ncbi:4-coumarate--CoA ligase [Noviherbaspirillum aerium]|uniref:4-coumarate--CoA ligase n=1 Tax=Noviherbaspirillum aerium TaxID=2588497 RepID=UPI001CEF74C0|nr:4-coumarate--CoA ligase [Noviherbaspirillum aerium]